MSVQPCTEEKCLSSNELAEGVVASCNHAEFKAALKAFPKPAGFF